MVTIDMILALLRKNGREVPLCFLSASELQKAAQRSCQARNDAYALLFGSLQANPEKCLLEAGVAILDEQLDGEDLDEQDKMLEDAQAPRTSSSALSAIEKRIGGKIRSKHSSTSANSRTTVCRRRARTPSRTNALLTLRPGRQPAAHRLLHQQGG